MGLLDSVVGMLGQNQNAGAAGGGNAALINAVIGMLGNNGNAGAQAGIGGAAGGIGGGGNLLGSLGGIAGLIALLQQSGLGDIVASWISTGQNLPVSASQLQGALGADTVASLSQQTGMAQGDLLSQLTQLLPQVVDRLTPNGQAPSGQDALGDLSGLMGAFLKR